jgi:hypothetical protein
MKPISKRNEMLFYILALDNLFSFFFLINFIYIFSKLKCCLFIFLKLLNHIYSEEKQ